MRLKRHAYYCLFVISAAVLASCAAEDPTSVDRPPVVRYFYPEDQIFDAFVGDTVSFRIVAIDPDETSLKQRFSLNDSLVSSLDSWDYVIEGEGISSIKCVVSDGINDARISWEVTQLDPVNYPPEIYAFTPFEENPVMVIGDELEFGIEASDPEEVPLAYFFTVDDSLVTEEADFIFKPTTAGYKVVEGVVTDGEYFATHSWNLRVTPVPDTIPPAVVPLTVVATGDDPGEIIVEWTAVGADGMQGVASNYLVRTLPSPMLDEISWSRGSDRPDVPVPAAPGEPMRIVINGLIPARFAHVAVRAVDDFGNLSPLGESPGVYTRGLRISGRVMDSVTGAPMADQHVELAHFRTLTDADGEFEFIELPPLDDPLIVSDDNQPGTIGEYFDYHLVYEVNHLDHIVVAMIPDIPLVTNYYPDFLTFFIGMTEHLGLPLPRHQRRFEAPIDVHANPFVHLGIDYQAVVQQAVTGLNPLLGFDAFRIVDAIPDVGVHCVYLEELGYDNYGIRVWSDDWYPIQGVIEFRTGYSTGSQRSFERVIRHEFGHVLGLNHSEDQNHLMVGGVAPQVDYFSSDEINVIKTRFNIPRGVPLASYIRE